MSVLIGATYPSNNYGEFVVLDKVGINRYSIKFFNTGSITTASSDAIQSGRVKDKYFPLVAGIGYVGSFDGKVSSKEIMPFYSSWNDMINRCYNKNDKDYKYYGALGITVDSRWHNFGNYYEDIKLLPNYNKKLLYPREYQLDKDYLQLHIPKSQRIYSRHTCMWISKYDNTMIMNRDNCNDRNSYYGVTKITIKIVFIM